MYFMSEQLEVIIYSETHNITTKINCCSDTFEKSVSYIFYKVSFFLEIVS